MRTINANNRISLEKCREILNKGEKQYTDEEIIIMRDWLYQMAELTLNFLTEVGQEKILNLKRKIEERKKE